MLSKGFSLMILSKQLRQKPPLNLPQLGRLLLQSLLKALPAGEGWVGLLGDIFLTALISCILTV